MQPPAPGRLRKIILLTDVQVVNNDVHVVNEAEILALAQQAPLQAVIYPVGRGRGFLAKSPEGKNKDAELTGQVPPPYQTESHINRGFFYKWDSHITLKTIANFFIRS